MIDEKIAEGNKKVCYTLGGAALLCGLLLVFVIQMGSGDFFDFDGSPPFVYWITFLALGGGIWGICRGNRFAQEEERLRARPVLGTQATVLSIQRRTDGMLEVVFRTEKQERLTLIQTDRCRYIEGDRGQLVYKGEYVVRFDYAPGGTGK